MCVEKKHGGGFPLKGRFTFDTPRRRPYQHANVRCAAPMCCAGFRRQSRVDLLSIRRRPYQQRARRRLRFQQPTAPRWATVARQVAAAVGAEPAAVRAALAAERERA